MGSLQFYLKRFKYAFSVNRKWFWMAFLPLAIFIVLMGLQTTEVTVTQVVTMRGDAPVSSDRNQNGYRPVFDLVENPNNFFQDTTALRELHIHLYLDAAGDETDSAFPRLLNEIGKTMSLGFESDSSLEITYTGKDQGFGETLVGFYGRRLVTKVKTGFARRAFHLKKKNELKSEDEFQPSLAGMVSVNRHRKIFTMSRMPGAILILVLSLILYAVGIGVSDYINPSLKSERQIARYTELPLLGALPNLDKLAKKMGQE